MLKNLLSTMDGLEKLNLQGMSLSCRDGLKKLIDRSCQGGSHAEEMKVG